MLNRILEQSASPTPVVGMGVTRLSFSDRHPFTVVEVKTARKIVVQKDDAVRTDKNGMCEQQTYQFSPDPNGVKIVLTLRKDGRWREMGDDTDGWLIGERLKYHDHSF